MQILAAAVIFAIAACVTADLAPNPTYCYASDPIRPQQPRWSDRTSNNNARGFAVNPQVSSCTPARFWLYMRHGDRLPSTNDIERMIPFSNTVSLALFFLSIMEKLNEFLSSATNQHH
jgi:hypothetical protein